MFYSVLRTGRTQKLLQSYQSSFISQFRKVKCLYIPFMTRPEETLTEERMFFRVYYQSASTKDNRMKKLSVEDQGRLPPRHPSLRSLALTRTGGRLESYLDLDLIFLLFLFSLLIRFFLHFALMLLDSGINTWSLITFRGKKVLNGVKNSSQNKV